MADEAIHATELIVDTIKAETVQAKTTTIDTGGGILADGVIKTEGGKFVGRDTIEHANSPSQVVSFISPDNALLWSRLSDMVAAQEKSVNAQTNLTVALDDLPNRVGKLEVVYKPATEFEKLIIRLLVSVAAAIGISIGVAVWAWRATQNRRRWWR